VGRAGLAASLYDYSGWADGALGVLGLALFGFTCVALLHCCISKITAWMASWTTLLISFSTGGFSRAAFSFVLLEVCWGHFDCILIYIYIQTYMPYRGGVSLL
jgi:hypothetical protein